MPCCKGVEAFVFSGPVAEWIYMGAAEDSEPSSTWFSDRAARAPRGVFAARATPAAVNLKFPLVWRDDGNTPDDGGESVDVAAVDRSARYRQPVLRELRLSQQLQALANQHRCTVCVVIRDFECPDEIISLVEFGAALIQPHWIHNGCAPLDGAATVTLAAGKRCLLEVFLPLRIEQAEDLFTVEEKKVTHPSLDMVLVESATCVCRMHVMPDSLSYAVMTLAE